MLGGLIFAGSGFLMQLPENGRYDVVAACVYVVIVIRATDRRQRLLAKPVFAWRLMIWLIIPWLAHSAIF